MTRSFRIPDRLDVVWLATLPPAALIGLLIIGNAVDTPFWDDWNLISDTLLRANSGELGLRELIAQHNESRPFFPRLLFLAIGTLARGDGRWMLLVTFSLACQVSYSVFLLARATVKTGPRHLWTLSFLANLLIFTPMAAEAWLWSSYVGLAPIACMSANLALLQSGLSPGKKLAISSALCTVATFSYANGVLTWLLVAPVLVLAVGPRWLGWWSLGLLLNAGTFFYGYAKPVHHPELLDGLQLVRLGHYLLAFLGASLGLGRLALATAVGALLLGVFGLIGVYVLRHPHDRQLRRRVTPWLAIGGYALLSGLAAAAGRSSLGVRQALANRYIPFSLYLGLALLFLVPIVLQHAGSRSLQGSPLRRVVPMASVVCLSVCLVLQANAMVIGARGMGWVGRMMRYGKSCLLFINVHRDEACLSSWVYPNSAALHAYANDLDRLGYLRPGLVRSERLQDLRAYGPGLRNVGVFSVFRNAGQRYVAAGWAGLPTEAGPADAVILARQGRDGSWAPIQFVPVLEPRPDVAAVRGPAYRQVGWRAGLLKRDLPPRPFPIGAWAFDAQRGWALPLQGVYTAGAGTKAQRNGG